MLLKVTKTVRETTFNMSAMSAALSKSDIVNIAKHYSKQPAEIFTKY